MRRSTRFQLILGLVTSLGCGGAPPRAEMPRSYITVGSGFEAATSDEGEGPVADASPPSPMALGAASSERAIAVEGATPQRDRAAMQVPPAGLLTAATVGDADRPDAYRAYLMRRPHEAALLGLDMTRQVRFRVVDRDGRPINDANIELNGRVHGRTHADGYWHFFASTPWARGIDGELDVRVSAGQSQVSTTLDLAQVQGGDVVIRLEDSSARGATALDLAFLIDVTGSMEDELRYVNNELTNIVARVRNEAAQTDVRVGAVFYRDVEDDIPLQQIPFTRDLDSFVALMRRVSASGGGDYPEDMNAGLSEALSRLDWRTGNAVRVLAVVADAPPHNYQGANFRYTDAMRIASEEGIRILPVAASGADRVTEFLLRAMGACTSTPYTYLTDHSGIGGHHMNADTDRVGLERFNDLLVRLLISDLRGEGMHELGVLGPNGE